MLTIHRRQKIYIVIAVVSAAGFATTLLILITQLPIVQLWLFLVFHLNTNVGTIKTTADMFIVDIAYLITLTLFLTTALVSYHRYLALSYRKDDQS